MNSPRLFAASRKGLFVLERIHSGWSVVAHHFPGEPVTQCLADPRDGTWYAALRLGHFGVKFKRSTNQGKGWEELPAPSLPAKPQVSPWAQETSSWNVDMIWSLMPGGPGSAGELWAGCAPAALFRSLDAGEHWQLVESLWFDPRRLEWMGGGYDMPGIHSICVDPVDPQLVRIAISCGGIWQTADSGASWSLLGQGLKAPYVPPEQTDNPNIQDVHALAQCRSSRNVFWAQHHEGCYRSEDGGRSFRRLPSPRTSDFGFPILADPENPRRAWIVPATSDTQRYAARAALHVARTDDGGETWQILDKGLPQRHAYDLVYRHGLALAQDRCTMALGSTTGGLWISEDAGESWSAPEARLPPLLQLRFA